MHEGRRPLSVSVAAALQFEDLCHLEGDSGETMDLLFVKTGNPVTLKILAIIKLTFSTPF